MSAPFADVVAQAAAERELELGVVGDRCATTRNSSPSTSTPGAEIAAARTASSSIPSTSWSGVRPSLRDRRRQEREGGLAERRAEHVGDDSRPGGGRRGGVGERTAQLRRVAHDPRRGEELAGGVEVDARRGVERRRRRRQGLSGCAAH